MIKWLWRHYMRHIGRGHDVYDCLACGHRHRAGVLEFRWEYPYCRRCGSVRVKHKFIVRVPAKIGQWATLITDARGFRTYYPGKLTDEQIATIKKEWCI